MYVSLRSLCSFRGPSYIEAIYDLFQRDGYDAQICFFRLKLQSNPLWSIPQYAEHEKEGITFTYFPYDEAMQQLEGKDITSGEQMNEELASLRLSSAEALKRAEAGERVGYIAVLIIAEKKPL